MKRIVIAGGLFLLSAGMVLAHSGQHNFSGNTLSSSGDNLTSTYYASGSFPYDGHGNYDGAKVNLTGTYTLVSENGTPVGTSYCVKTTGNINRRGTGKLTEKIYSDLNCKVYQQSINLTVNSFSENVSGDVTMVVTDGNRVTYTTTGAHSYSGI